MRFPSVRMKTLHILDSLNRGGAETMLLDVCRNVTGSGLDLTFVATGGGDLEQEFRRSGVDFIRLQRKLPLDPGLVYQLRRIILERGIQVVHSQQPVEALHLYLATRGLPTRQVLTLQGLYPGTKNELVLKFLLPRMQALIVPSLDLRRVMVKEQGIDPGNDCILLRNCVDLKGLVPQGRKVRKELGLSEDALLVGMVAHFYADRRKDQLTVCRSLPAVFERVSEAHFVFVGSRSDTAPQLFNECVNFCREHGISGRVHFLGTRGDIPDLLNSLDVFVLSSNVEGLPIAAIQALTMGVPSVLSDIGSLREISDDGQYAVLFRTGDAADLAEKLTSLLENRERRATLGATATQWALSQFSVQQYIQNLTNLYKRLVS